MLENVRNTNHNVYWQITKSFRKFIFQTPQNKHIRVKLQTMFEVINLYFLLTLIVHRIKVIIIFFKVFNYFVSKKIDIFGCKL